MEKRFLGKQNVEVSALGLGCMVLSSSYGAAEEKDSIRTIHKAIEMGITLLDTADVYGLGHNEQLLAKALKGKRDRVLIISKFGLIWNDRGEVTGIDASPQHVKEACEASLMRLQTDHLDFYLRHRLDANTSIEETVSAMAELEKEGKIRFLGICEVSAETLRRAQRVHEITVLQSEYSLWSRHIEAEILPTARELGIGFVAYSPLGRGFLTGGIRRDQDLAEKDHRRTFPRFSKENLSRNLELLCLLEEIAKTRGCTSAQVALAWVLSRGKDIVPIPGTRSTKHLIENINSLEMELTGEELLKLENLADRVSGERFNEQAMRLIEH